ncbi:MAG: hypothetical protein ACJAZO_002485 [Myxococcota bacterium]|jgi:hypothetical protein
MDPMATATWWDLSVDFDDPDAFAAFLRRR